MRILDRYIVRQFVLTFLFGLVAVVLIFLVIDMMEKLDDFIDARVPAETVVEYYLSFCPEIIKLMTPVAMLLAALFVMGRLTNYNEWAAMKSSGVSLYRLLLPFLGVALVVSAASVYFNGWIVPYANQKKFSIERIHLRKGGDSFSRFNIFFLEGRTRIVSIGYYDPAARRATRVSIQEYADTNLTVLVNRMDAVEMTWRTYYDTLKHDAVEGWVLNSGTIRTLEPAGEVFTRFAEHPVGRLTINPDDIEKKQRKPEEMDYPELRQFIESQRLAGQDVARWMVEYHSKVAFPFASVIVVLFGVTFGSIRRRSGVAVEFGISVAATFTYMGFMKTSQVFGYNGDLHPLLTAWLANIIFAGAGIVNMFRVPK